MRISDWSSDVCSSDLDGVSEITLLGQNVNAYGVEFGDRQAFSKLLRACGAIEGLERVRFTSPHPAEFTDDVIEAMAETPTSEERRVGKEVVMTFRSRWSRYH